MITADKAYTMLMTWLKNSRPFSFFRFNDGEMNAVMGWSKAVARGDQEVSAKLRKDLSDCLITGNGNYIIGAPCGTCFPRQRKAFDGRITPGASVVPATLFCNGGRWNKFLRDGFNALRGKQVTWVAGADQQLNAVISMMRPKDITRILVNSHNSYDEINEVSERLWNMPDGVVTIFTCGPLGRILAKQGFDRQPEATWLDLGSVYDPLTRGVWHRCHLLELPKCRECNP